MIPMVSRITATDNYQLIVAFSNGENGMFDGRTLLEDVQFSELHDEHYFQKVSLDDDGVCWPEGETLSAKTLYEAIFRGLDKQCGVR